MKFNIFVDSSHTASKVKAKPICTVSTIMSKKPSDRYFAYKCPAMRLLLAQITKISMLFFLQLRQKTAFIKPCNPITKLSYI